MKVRAQIDKVMPTGEETLKVCIGGEEEGLALEFSDLQESLDFLSHLFDDRLRFLNVCLIEDGHFLDYMTEEEKAKFKTAFDALYYVSKGASLPLNIKEYTKFQIGKKTGKGEAITIELSGFDKYEDIEAGVKDTLTYLDKRLIEENEKDLKYSEIIKSFDYDTQLLIGKAFDALFGRISSNQAENMIQGYVEQRKEKLNGDSEVASHV